MKYCSSCGKKITEGAKFCGKCGNKVVGVRSTENVAGEDVGFFNYYLLVLKKYAVFKGRARRKEYWSFILVNFLIAIVIAFIEGMFGIYPESDESVWGIFYQLAVLIPSISVGVRRMHDVGKSGLYLIIPIYNLILAFRDGTVGDNEYGSDPKGRKGSIDKGKKIEYAPSTWKESFTNWGIFLLIGIISLIAVIYLR